MVPRVVFAKNTTRLVTFVSPFKGGEMNGVTVPLYLHCDGEIILDFSINQYPPDGGRMIYSLRYGVTWPNLN